MRLIASAVLILLSLTGCSSGTPSRPAGCELLVATYGQMATALADYQTGGFSQSDLAFINGVPEVFERLSSTGGFDVQTAQVLSDFALQYNVGISPTPSQVQTFNTAITNCGGVILGTIGS